MVEYISREAVVRYLKGYSEKECNSNSPYGMITSSVLNKAERALSEMPAADVQSVDRWISVKDRFPDEDGWYLVCKHNRIRVAEWCKDCWYNESDLPIDDCTITYWKPLPEPPQD